MLLRHSIARLLICSLLLIVFAFDVGAAPGVAKKSKKKKKGKDETEQVENKDSPFKPWKEVTKDAEVMEGFFTLYKKPDKLLLALNDDQLEMDFLGISSMARGIGQNWLLGGLPLNDRLLAFHRNGNSLILYEKNARFVAPAGTPFEKAVELSHGHSVLEVFKIESIHDDTKAMLIDATPLLVSDLSDLKEFLNQAFEKSGARFDKKRSSITEVKNFPDNTEIEVLLTYSPSNRRDLQIETVPDERYIPLSVHYSFSKLPEVPMTPRLADDRVGNFLTVKKDFSLDEGEDFWVRFVNRWRLEKKDPTATLSDPVKPVVWYIDHTVPLQYRSYLKKGIENWQKAFEAAGFKNAIIAKDAPDDPNWAAEDVRYSTIRWIASSRRAFGAIGPSRKDPRTGEILDADILFEGGMVQNFRNGYRRMISPEAIANQLMPTLDDVPAFLSPDLMCAAQHGLADGGAMLRMHLLGSGVIAPGGDVPEEYVGKALVWVTMHEVGHSLGLRHNFRSSTATPVDRMHDWRWTSTHGLTGSVMDYPAPNIAVNEQTQGEYYGSCAGDYDVWAIRYAYTPSGTTDLDQDYAFASRIAEESRKPGHEYGTDYDTYPQTALDPRSNIWDMGGDPLLFARQRSAYIKALWSSGKIEDHILGERGAYPALRRTMNTLLGQYARAVGLAVKYIGGQYAERNHRGQPGAVDPLTPVDAGRQREAHAFLAENLFAVNAFDVSPELLNRLAPDRWSHWGLESPFSPNARIDYNLEERAFAIQNAAVRALTAPKLLARMREAENRSEDPFSMSEHFRTLTKSLWGEVGGGIGAGMRALMRPSTRRHVQRAYVDRLAQIMTAPAPGTPDDARALARLQLTRIDGQARRGLTSEGLNDDLRAHLLESRARIKRALEAQQSVGGSGGRSQGGHAFED